MFKCTITKEFSQADMADIMCAAFEGGSNYWIEEIKIPDFGGHKYASDVVAHGLPIIIVTDEGEEHELNVEKLNKGLAFIGNNYPNTMTLLCEGYDANDADMLVQAALFGEIVYG
jgi:hypothetical protein